MSLEAMPRFAFASAFALVALTAAPAFAKGTAPKRAHATPAPKSAAAATSETAAPAADAAAPSAAPLTVKAPETAVAAPTSPAAPAAVPVATTAPLPATTPEPDDAHAGAPKTSLSGAGAFVLPVGTLSDFAGVGVGALLGVRHRVLDRLDLTGRAGFVYHFSKDHGSVSTGLSEVPILAGVRYTFVPSGNGGLYGAGELGLMFVIARQTAPKIFSNETTSTSSTSTKLSMTLGAGYAYENFDFRGSLLMLDVGHLGDAIGLMASVGYSFASF